MHALAQMKILRDYRRVADTHATCGEHGTGTR
jgi:hypothetical protein